MFFSHDKVLVLCYVTNLSKDAIITTSHQSISNHQSSRTGNNKSGLINFRFMKVKTLELISIITCYLIDESIITYTFNIPNSPLKSTYY